MSEQKGVFRVNCIDCLDRTNVVQVRMMSDLVNRLSERWMCSRRFLGMS